MSFTFNYSSEKLQKNGSSKKRISSSKKRIHKNLWKGKGYWVALKAFS